ncbi:MAG: Bug family tripartite tricarboxylate transporter substrate binding protein [Burkholderiales bacterium]
MRNTRFNAGLLVAAIFASATVFAQEYPNKAIRMVIPEPPGGGHDRVSRLVADKLREKWGQPVIVETRTGAGGNIAAELVANAAPDGYTVLYSPPGPLVVNKALYASLSFDPDTFVAISQLTSAPSALLVHPRFAGDLRQFIAYAKANPGKLNYASSGSGTTQHLGAELLKSMADMRIEHVPFKGQAPALLALVSGQVDTMLANLGTTLPQIRAGKMRALAVGSARRSAALPDVPALSEVLPGMSATTWSAMVAPAGTPAPIINKVSAAIGEIMKQPDVVKQLGESLTDAVGGTPAELAQLMKEERQRWGTVIRATGAKAD